ncbi:Flp family type IVb pilin [Flexibacterium corallicola]|uniref:Flp family type IVb pilin n=1 Tax=Flexibacterium corallicola TaxID=3037259 RepID=UPI00286F164A|nr:Flp family type IVb pilin [Pseudovibrio sp. M1P-2-3]
MTLIRNFLKDEFGTTAIEYGIIASLISITIIATVRLIGPKVLALFTTINAGL